MVKIQIRNHINSHNKTINDTNDKPIQRPDRRIRIACAEATPTMTLTSPEPTLVQTDSRKRVSLAGRVVPGAYYLVTSDSSGRITLEPAEVVSKLEREVLNNAQIMAEVAAYRADPSDVVEDDQP